MTTPFTPDLQKRLIEAIEAMSTVTPCVRCDFFDAGTEGGYCRKFEAAVPEENQADAHCPEWVPLLPF